MRKTFLVSALLVLPFYFYGQSKKELIKANNDLTYKFNVLLEQNNELNEKHNALKEKQTIHNVLPTAMNIYEHQRKQYERSATEAQPVNLVKQRNGKNIELEKYIQACG